MKEIIECLKRVVNSINNIINIKEIIKINNDTYKLMIDKKCNNIYPPYLYIRVCQKLTLNNNVYEVVDFNNDEIILKALNPKIELINLTRITLPKPILVHGTLPMEDLVISQACYNSPIIYLRESLSITKQSIFSIQNFVVNSARISFLLDYSENWVTAEHHQFAFQPLEILSDMFIFGLKRDKSIDKEFIEEDGYDIEYKVKNGNFSRNLDSAEIKINLPFLKNQKCIC